MRRYRVQATLESPLVIRRERQSQRSEGVSHISGTLVRGAFAQIYLQNVGQADTVFQRIFLDEGACRFGPLDPADRVLPLTTVSCKRDPGFRSEGHHGMLDRLEGLLGNSSTNSVASRTRCPECQQDLKAYQGFWSLIDGEPKEPKRLWRRAIAAHVGIDRQTHTAAESIFYTLPVLEPEERPDDTSGAKLLGWLEAEEEVYQRLLQLLESEDQLLNIGHARTRGYGRVKVEVSETTSLLSQDVEAWSQALLPKLAPELREAEGAFIFSLSLPTGAILLDNCLRYTLDPAGMVSWLPVLPSFDPQDGTLKNIETELGAGTLQCLTAVARHERLRGWNAAHGLPRQDEWLVSRGAVYVYLYQGPQGGFEELKVRLTEIQAQGIGARRNEGFGKVLISDEFHTNITRKEVL